MSQQGAVIDPRRFQREFWPDDRMYGKQWDVVYSVQDNIETYVAAGNKLGKDFVAAFICMWFFMTRHPCRIVTTSAGHDHLSVLWGEIGRFIQRSRIPLSHRRGGPLVLNHLKIRKMVGAHRWTVGPGGARVLERSGTRLCDVSYVEGLVAGPDNLDKMGGHHVSPESLERANDGVPRTLLVVDEASSADDEYYTRASPWASRFLVFGNTWPCDNFFRKNVEAGDLLQVAGGSKAAKDAKGEQT